MVKGHSTALVEDIFSFVAKGRVADVVKEGEDFGEVLIEFQGSGEVAGHLGDFQTVCQSGPIEVALADDKDLSLVFSTRITSTDMKKITDVILIVTMLPKYGKLK